MRKCRGKKRKKNRKLINEGARRKEVEGEEENEDRMNVKIEGRKNEWVVGTEGVEGRGE